MNLEHVTAFTAAMQRKDLDAMLSHVAGDVVLNPPLKAEPVLGKEAIREVVGPLLAVVDAFDFREIMQGPEHVSSKGVRAGSVLAVGCQFGARLGRYADVAATEARCYA
jgi:hypothetical protein